MTDTETPDPLDELRAVRERLRRPPCWGPNAQGDHMVDMTVEAYERDLDALVAAASAGEAAPGGLRVGTLGDGERCNRCRGENVSWFVASPLWNYVMRGNDINGEAQFRDLVCIPCFIVLTEEAGLPSRGWRLTIVPEPEGLIYETPTGRVWDAERGMWGEPNPAVETEPTIQFPDPLQHPVGYTEPKETP